METKSCCVTGHRDISSDNAAFVKQELRNTIEQAIADGYNNFISGFAPGADMIFARLVVEEQIEHPGITLEAALPYPNWLKTRPQEDIDLLNKCHVVGAHSKKYSPNCFLVRNRFMVNTCERVIAVYDGREKGGTVSTMRFAAVLKRDIKVIRI